jgi:glycerophosphoryl diester phosphodiesterase
MGCNWVECDCRACADGTIVLAHDPSVTDSKGLRHLLAQHTCRELAALDLGQGQGVPTLEELVRWAVRCGCAVMADIKQAGLELQIGTLLGALPCHRILVPGADAAGRSRFRQMFPDLPLSLSVDAANEALLEAQWQHIDTEAVTLQHPLVTSTRVADLHGRGIRVYAWTVDEPDTMRALLGMGVDGIISNRADVLHQILCGRP